MPCMIRSFAESSEMIRPLIYVNKVIKIGFVYKKIYEEFPWSHFFHYSIIACNKEG